MFDNHDSGGTRSALQRVDDGSEFISRDLNLWAYANEVTLDFSRPGKPMGNAFIKAFNGKFRLECLNTHWFLTLADAREKLENWPLSAIPASPACSGRDDNEIRPHSAIAYNVLIAVQNHYGETNSP